MNSAQKLSLQKSLELIAQRGALQAIELMGASLPASVVSAEGGIVTVKFEVLSDYNLPQITVPVAGSQYVREPLQPGDMGMLIPCDGSIQAVSGQGENVADLSDQANLASLVFLPIGNKKWKGVDGKMLVLTGLTDVMIRDDSHQLQLETEQASWATLITNINSLLTVIGPLLTTPTVLTPLNATLNPVKTRT